MGQEFFPPRTATKEIFYQASPLLAGTAAWATVGTHAGVDIDASGEGGYVEAYIPWDFTTLVSIVIVFAPQASVAPMYIRLYTDYGAKGENAAAHAEGPVNKPINVTAQIITELDISDLVDSGPLAAGDYLGVLVTHTNNTDIRLLGLRLRYS